MAAEADRWFSVRCVFQWHSRQGQPFEERITLWRATSVDDAIRSAEEEALAYAEASDVTYLRFAQAYALDEGVAIGHGTELYSLLRDSELAPEQYLDAFFDTGRERTA